jgi:hypothetical protein
MGGPLRGMLFRRVRGGVLRDSGMSAEGRSNMEGGEEE